uniref:Ig-like domain-containing protein n=1 Tax=Stegastes partitus TaxID=144197 RepID=A0A3B5AKA8_9TELE
VNNNPSLNLSVNLHPNLYHFFAGESRLVGPPQPIVGTLGDVAILPCHLEPAVDVSGMTLEWTKSDTNAVFVHVWRSHQVLEHTQHRSYKGRTSLFASELKTGNISLKLSDIKPSDQGTYKCFIPSLTLNRSSVLPFEVSGGASFLTPGSVSSPGISLAGLDRSSRSVVLQCESAGWYPEPELLWLDGEGKLLSAGPPETVRGPDDLYTVSSRVTVEKRHSKNASFNHLDFSEVIGPSQPIVATLGDDITLLCHLEPAQDVSELTTEWTRSDLNPRFVHVWRAGQELVDMKHKSFKGRTTLFTEELQRGNVSLRLSRVRLSDKGTYRCFIPALKKQTDIQLVVGEYTRAVSQPEVRISGMDGDTGGAVLQCESAGWYPEPELLWLDGEGKLLSAGPPETVRVQSNAGCFHALNKTTSLLFCLFLIVSSSQLDRKLQEETRKREKTEKEVEPLKKQQETKVHFIQLKFSFIYKAPNSTFTSSDPDSPFNTNTNSEIQAARS